MPAPPWGHKPPPVADVQAYWAEPPPEPSERCAYWMRRRHEGSWTPNKWVHREGYYGRALHLGVWIWEACNVPELRLDDDELQALDNDI